MEDLLNKNQVDFGKTTMHKASGSDLSYQHTLGLELGSNSLHHCLLSTAPSMHEPQAILTVTVPSDVPAIEDHI